LTTMLSRRAFLVTTSAKTSHFRGFLKRCSFARHKTANCVEAAETLKKHARWLDLAADVYVSLAEGDEDPVVARRYAEFLEGIPDDPLDETVLARLMTGAAADLRASEDCSDA